MHCPNCGNDNRAGRRFCSQCGTALAVTCSNCGAGNEAEDLFCGNCGSALDASASATPQEADLSRLAPEAERRLVSVLFDRP